MFSVLGILILIYVFQTSIVPKIAQALKVRRIKFEPNEIPLDQASSIQEEMPLKTLINVVKKREAIIRNKIINA